MANNWLHPENFIFRKRETGEPLRIHVEVERYFQIKRPRLLHRTQFTTIHLC